MRCYHLSQQPYLWWVGSPPRETNQAFGTQAVIVFTDCVSTERVAFFLYLLGPFFFCFCCFIIHSSSKLIFFFFRVENLNPTETNHSRVLNQHFTQYSSPVLGVSCSNLPQLLSFQSLVLPSLVSHWREVTMVSTLGVFLPCCVF